MGCLFLGVMERQTEEKGTERSETIKSRFRSAVVCEGAMVY